MPAAVVESSPKAVSNPISTIHPNFFPFPRVAIVHDTPKKNNAYVSAR